METEGARNSVAWHDMNYTCPCYWLPVHAFHLIFFLTKIIHFLIFVPIFSGKLNPDTTVGYLP